MNKSIRISVSETFTSITIENGASRQTSGRTMAEVLAALPADDKDTVLAFCRTMVETLAPPTVTVAEATSRRWAISRR